LRHNANETAMSANPFRKKQPQEDFALFPEASAAQDAAEIDGRLSVDVLENEGSITVRAPIAGVKPDDLEVFAHDGMLTIRGSRRAEYEEEHAGYLVRECHWGAFSRSVLLPPGVNADAITANLKDGVLTVTLPKAKKP